MFIYRIHHPFPPHTKNSRLRDHTQCFFMFAFPCWLLSSLYISFSIYYYRIFIFIYNFIMKKKKNTINIHLYTHRTFRTRTYIILCFCVLFVLTLSFFYKKFLKKQNIKRTQKQQQNQKHTHRKETKNKNNTPKKVSQKITTHTTKTTTTKKHMLETNGTTTTNNINEIVKTLKNQPQLHDNSILYLFRFHFWNFLHISTIYLRTYEPGQQPCVKIVPSFVIKTLFEILKTSLTYRSNNLDTTTSAQTANS